MPRLSPPSDVVRYVPVVADAPRSFTREPWGWIELFAAIQLLWGVLLFIPGAQPYRMIVRALPYVVSLGALIFALRRSIVPYRQSVAAGAWQKSGQFCYFDYPIRDVAGSTLGVIGDGTLGQSVGDIGKALGMRVLYAAYKGTTGMGPLYTPFEEVLGVSDVITLHCPLLPSTRNMIGAAEFALMTRRPLVINAARGGLVDEHALADALERGLIAGAGFDVVTAEPPPQDHPFMRLLERSDFILTPHVAWASREAIQALADQLIENIELFWRGTPRNVVAL